MIPSDNDTWGISGPAFLLAYVVLAVAAGVTAVLTRRRLADGSSQRRVSRPDGRPYDVAYANGGADLALCAALSAMHRAGTLSTTGRGVVVAARRPDSRADELERAIHHAAAVPVSRHRLVAAGAVASALHRIEQRLIADGLLLSAPDRQRIRMTGAWLLAVAALGVVRVMAGYANGRPVVFLVVAVVLVFGLGLRAAADPRGRRPAAAAGGRPPRAVAVDEARLGRLRPGGRRSRRGCLRRRRAVGR